MQELLRHIQRLSEQALQMQSEVRLESNPTIGTEGAERAVRTVEALQVQAEADVSQASQIAQDASGQLAETAGSVEAPPPPPPSPGQAAPPEQKMTAPPTPVTSPPTTAADPESVWFDRLKSGLLQYHVPATMKWRVASTVTVVIGGSGAAPAQIPDQTGSAQIKVSPWMKVVAYSADNPDEFVITPLSGTQEKQRVWENGTTTWNWSVTPRFTGAQKRIAIRAWVIYPDSTDAQRELPVYTAVVNVRVPSFGECVKRLVEGDPDYWIKYGLPGGAGFVFVGGVVTFIRKLRPKKTKAHAHHRIKTA